MPRGWSVGRRGLGHLVLAGATGLARPGLAQTSAAQITAARAAAAQAAAAQTPAQERATTLILGLDIMDTVTFDPARQINYSPPMTLAACYDRLVTMTPGQYEKVVPALAASWARTPDDRGWRFTLRPDAVFASGNRVTPEDCAFSLNRLLAIGDSPSHYLDNIITVVPSGPETVDILLKVPEWPLLPYLAAATYAILERAVVEANGGGLGGAGLPSANGIDRATQWLDQHTAGSGAYTLSGWTRRESIRLDANPNAWRGKPGYARVVLRHIPDSTAQLRAVQRGDIDAAFNLSAEHIAQLQTDPIVRVQSTRSLDLVYLALNGDPARNPALAKREVRRAVAAAIDYDDVLGRMLNGTAVRPASFLPIGLSGSDEATAKAIGIRQDLDLSRQLLTQAGLADGFGFELSYVDSAIAGLSYESLARKLRTDLARVGITAKLVPMNPYSWRAAFVAGKLAATLSFWTSPIADSAFWAQACLDRLAPRIGMAASPDFRALIERAATETDAAEKAVLWSDYQRTLLSLGNLIVLFQPSYQVAVRSGVADLKLTAAGWMADFAGARPRKISGAG